MKLDIIDKNLLNIIQTEFPLSRKPFAALGLRLGISSDEVIRRIERLRSQGIIRLIGPVFNAQRLGYRTTLVAMRVAMERLDEAGRIISAHPLVSHCYQRDHDFNFWFTLAVPVKKDVESEVHKLGSGIQAEATLNLPAVRTFKIGAYFHLSGSTSLLSLRAKRGNLRDCLVAYAPRNDDKHRRPPASNSGIDYNDSLNTNFEMSATDRAVINELQQDLPLIERPFDPMAAHLSMDADEFLNRCQALLRLGVMRRFSASINHNKIGFAANAMACWKTPPDMVESAGKKMAMYPEISHCYERQTDPLWPYNLFAMIHAKTKETCKAIAGKISTEAGLDENGLVLLFSTNEVKKTRARYQV